MCISSQVTYPTNADVASWVSYSYTGEHRINHSEDNIAINLPISLALAWDLSTLKMEFGMHKSFPICVYNRPLGRLTRDYI